MIIHGLHTENLRCWLFPESHVVNHGISRDIDIPLEHIRNSTIPLPPPPPMIIKIVAGQSQG